MKIFVAGGFNDNEPDLKAKTREFAQILGAEIINQGHTLINACCTEFDSVITESASQALRSNNQNPIDKITCYVPDGKEPIHNYGKIKISELKDWELGGPNLRIPEPIDVADVVVCVCGFTGTHRAVNWARIAKKPILPVVNFEGASKLIYREERNNFIAKYAGNISIEEFEDLSLTSVNDNELAIRIISLAERVNISRNVFVIMSFAEDPNLMDVYESFKEVCNRYEPKYVCQKMTEIHDVKRIFPEILTNIKNSAFTIVDLTLERPNVYYELGYAEALDKPIVVTAKKGTNIHFDAKDLPIIFWDSQTTLKKELVSRINQIAEKQGRKILS